MGGLLLFVSLFKCVWHMKTQWLEGWTLSDKWSGWSASVRVMAYGSLWHYGILAHWVSDHLLGRFEDIQTAAMQSMQTILINFVFDLPSGYNITRENNCLLQEVGWNALFSKAAIESEDCCPIDFWFGFILGHFRVRFKTCHTKYTREHSLRGGV